MADIPAAILKIGISRQRISFQCTLAPHGEYDCTIRVRQPGVISPKKQLN